MPNRIIKESICSSDTVDNLTAEEERLFTRLITKCDDFGCFDARPAIVRAECFPLKVDSITVESVANWIGALSFFGLIRLYQLSTRPYLEMVTWRKHQQTRATKPKYPLPTDSGCETIEITRNPLLAIASNGNQIPSYSYSYSYSYSETYSHVATQSLADASRPKTRSRATASAVKSEASESREMFGALAELFGYDLAALNTSQRGALNHAESQLRQSHVLPGQLPDLLIKVRNFLPEGATMTPAALAKNAHVLNGRSPTDQRARTNGRLVDQVPWDAAADIRKYDAIKAQQEAERAAEKAALPAP